MELDLKIKMNPKLFLKDPYESALGRKIVKESLRMINKIGFEAFNFKKLAADIETTEASVYRYFENKHRLLVYVINWYWSFTEYRMVFALNNLENPEIKLKSIIRLLVTEPENQATDFISPTEAYKLVIWEASKAYLTRGVDKDNKASFFKPYKDLCAQIAVVIKEVNPRYKYPFSLASTVLEMSHAQKFFMEHLPSLTDRPGGSNEDITAFIEHMVFNTVRKA